MSRYNLGSKRAKRQSVLPKRVWMLALVLALISVIGAVIVHHSYSAKLAPVNSNQTTQLFIVDKGSSVKEIAASLESKRLIRSAWAMGLYVHSKELGDMLQAGTYSFSPSQSTQQIVSTLTKGKVSTRLVTILPGRRIDQIRSDLINEGFTPSEVDKALDPATYADLPALAFKPGNVTTLEGLMWPDSFQKDATTSPGVIIRQSLVEMGEHLTPEVQAAFASQGLTTYQGLILASIVAQEVSKPTDQTQAAQVFLTRLKGGIMLGSDVTARYGSIVAGRTPNLNYDSPYNTLLHAGLPPTPISTINANSLSAATKPAATDWLFFVAGDDGTTHFSKTLAEHQALTDKYCHQLCGR